MKNDSELTTSQVAKRFGISGIALNKILAKNNVIIKKGRPARSEKGKYRPYWWINQEFIQYGYNKVNARGGSIPTWYAWKTAELENIIKSFMNIGT